MKSDWSDLPEDMLFSIATRAEHLSDYIRFGAVSKSWRSAITVYPRPPLHLRFPFLLLSRDNKTRDHALYSPLERKLHPIRLPDRSRPKRCLGSTSDGWVCMIDDNLHLYLLNPFSGAVVLLPPLSTDFITDGSFEHVLKAVWSAEPSIIVILLCKKEERETVYYCRPGDARWKVLETSLEFLHDAVLFNKGLYVMNWEARRVAAIDHHGRGMMMAAGPNKFMYLAGCPSGPLLVVRHMKNVYETRRFELFEPDSKMKKWVKTKSLDDGMLFLGMNTAIWLSSSSLKECKGNSIYFMDRNRDGVVEDLGIFYLEDGSFGSICGLDEKPLYDSFEWVVPIL
ncbi:putative F-box protein [Acorus gramineus]|uniref:F-box protein n=1 Tax=Acorus gramineus TaxID=55184 RepID=A0AAV9B530_ACOGR|nr:putative F-box protein [Acorus gramineus]